jgi:hypothetical protein
MRKLFSTLVLNLGLIALGTAASASVVTDDVATVPEPTAFLTMGVGLGVIALGHRLRRR